MLRFNESIDEFVAQNFPENVQPREPDNVQARALAGYSMKKGIKREINEILIESSDEESNSPPVQGKPTIADMMYSTSIASTENAMATNSSELKEPIRGQLVRAETIIQSRKNSNARKRWKKKCEICNYVSRNRSHFTTHMAIHSGLKFVCDKCNKGFSQRGNLKRHEQRKTLCTGPLDFRGFESAK